MLPASVDESDGLAYQVAQLTNELAEQKSQLAHARAELSSAQVERTLFAQEQMGQQGEAAGNQQGVALELEQQLHLAHAQLVDQQEVADKQEQSLNAQVGALLQQVAEQQAELGLATEQMKESTLVHQLQQLELSLSSAQREKTEWIQVSATQSQHPTELQCLEPYSLAVLYRWRKHCCEKSENWRHRSRRRFVSGTSCFAMQ